MITGEKKEVVSSRTQMKIFGRVWATIAKSIFVFTKECTGISLKWNLIINPIPSSWSYNGGVGPYGKRK